MAANARPVHKRILFKSSGEALQDTESFGTNAGILDRIAQEIEGLVELGVQVGVVIDRGNLFRGTGLAEAGVNRVMGDHIGMLATVMNGLTMHDALHRVCVNTRLVSAIPLNGMCDSYSWTEAVNLLRNNRVMIPPTGTGNPFFITDSATYLRDIEVEADVVPKATRVDGVFTADPAKGPTATMYEQLTYSEVLEKELKVMDLAAFALAHDHKLPIRVFNMSRPSVLHRMVMGEKEGALVTE